MKRKVVTPRSIRRKEWNGDIVYFVGSESIKRVKIGKSSNVCFLTRLSDLQIGFPGRLHVFGIMLGGFKDERKLHHTFKSDRTGGEWFVLTDEIKEFIESNTCDFVLRKYSHKKRIANTKQKTKEHNPTRKEIVVALKEYFADGLSSGGLKEMYKEFKDFKEGRRMIEKLALDYYKRWNDNV